ncbi:hypothetical protein QYM36_005345 [Artemia franciscana]|uniref:Uncharacterized protein n=1 Tax=Artemia franciscana TaxID=6661 RepID=A0AA88I2F7_ARTSF|nr:hypothetical protein QYM36_005345 [Artemia franciscana]
MNCYQADVLCLSETRLNGVSEETMPVRDSDNSYLFLSYGAHDGSGDHGVRFMIGRRAQKALLAWDPVNPRIARLKLKEDYSTFLSLLSTHQREWQRMLIKTHSNLIWKLQCRNALNETS